MNLQVKVIAVCESQVPTHMRDHLEPRSYLQLTSTYKGKINFLQCSLTVYSNHVQGQTPSSAADGQHTSNSMIFLCISCLILLCLGHFCLPGLLVYNDFQSLYVCLLYLLFVIIFSLLCFVGFLFLYLFFKQRSKEKYGAKLVGRWQGGSWKTWEGKTMIETIVQKSIFNKDIMQRVTEQETFYDSLATDSTHIHKYTHILYTYTQANTH